MSILFLFILFLLCIVRMPLSLVPILLKNLHPFFKERLNFERKNFLNESSVSFKQIGLIAHQCFEVSSEGELEQVRPLIEEALFSGKRIEILFSSPSVEAKLEKLYQSYPDHVRLMRLPLMTFWPFPFLYFQNFWWWVSAPTIIFCRYDFFPELLLLKLFRKKFVLVSGATKKLGLYKKLAYRLFDYIVAATQKEEGVFKFLGHTQINHCDLRIPRISVRSAKSAVTLFEHEDPAIVAFCQSIKNRDRRSQIIIGSCWKSDLEIFQDDQIQKDVNSGKLNVWIVPHKLDDFSMNEIKSRLNEMFGAHNVGFLSDQVAHNKPVMIVNRSGILCELYSLFVLAYVGGGYERSIHSVLEPFILGCKVICGPRVSRSTEFDLIVETAPAEIHVLKNPLSFYNVFKEMNSTGVDKVVRKNLVDQSLKTKAEVIKVINQL